MTDIRHDGPVMSDLKSEITPGKEKKKRIRRQKYEFIGGGIRYINGVQVRNGETALLTQKQVTREWRKVSG